MQIKIKKGLDLTPALSIYIESKLMPLGKFIKHFDEDGTAELWLEISRTTKHHRKGEVYLAAADLRLPGKILRGEADAENIRKAIDLVKKELQVEIDKYKTRKVIHRRR